MRILALLGAAAIPAAHGFGIVSLDPPGALERLKSERPTHFAAAAELIRASERMPCGHGDLEVIKARHGVDRFSCSMLVMASDPPKRRIDFTVETTRYVYTVTLKDARGRMMPAAGSAAIEPRKRP